MRPEETIDVVFGLRKHAYELKSLFVRNTRRQTLRAMFTKIVSQYSRKTFGIKTGRSNALDLLGPSFYSASVGLANNTLCGLEKGMYDFVRGNNETLFEEFKTCINTVESSGAPVFDSFISNELANAVANAIVTKALSPELTQTGRAIFVYGSRGSGKTTLVFWSLVSVLVLLGIPLHEAIKVVDSLWITSTEEYVEVQEIASEQARKGRALPFVVVEDAGFTLSKYMATPYAPWEERFIAINIGRMEQIAREGVCSTIFLAYPGSVIKSLRQVADLAVEGMFNDYSPRRHTIWVARATSNVKDVFATIHPTLKVPDELLRKWTEKKIEKRRELIEKLSDLTSSPP